MEAKAKGTVMNDEQIENSVKEFCSMLEGHKLGLKELVKAQAEITWDLAIREVVEWVIQNTTIGISSLRIFDSEKEWQAFLKKIGYKEVKEEELPTAKDLRGTAPVFTGDMNGELREKIAGVDFCWTWCGEDAITCQKKTTCPALIYRREERNYEKADQILQVFKVQKDAECQARIEKIFKEIENLLLEKTGAVLQYRDYWQTLKKQNDCSQKGGIWIR